MTETELITAIAEETGSTNVRVKGVLDAFKKCVITTVADGGEVKLKNLGKFYSTEDIPRPAYNFQTREVMYHLPPRRKVKFSVGERFREEVANK